MLIEMLALDKKVGEASEGQMTPGHVSLMGRPHGKAPEPAHFKEGDCALLQGRISHRHKLSILRFPVQQEQNSVRTEVQ